MQSSSVRKVVVVNGRRNLEVRLLIYFAGLRANDVRFIESPIFCFVNHKGFYNMESATDDISR